MPNVKLSPKKFDGKPYEFEWLTEGFAQVDSRKTEKQLRFRVYSQERKVHNELAAPVTKTLLKLWQYNVQKLGIDHRIDFNKSAVDVYLCWSGIAGGEQLFDYDPQTPRGQLSKVNTIYIYDLPSFTTPIERLREVAHEYGHASLPAVGGFDQPEYWANGYLGEKIFLTSLSEDANLNELGCTNEDVKNWVKKECDPLVSLGATSPPVLSGKSATAMKQYIGLMLWLHRILPADRFGRCFEYTKGLTTSEVPSAVAEGLEGADTFMFSVPKTLVGKPVWVPFAKMSTPGLTIKARKGSWIQVIGPSTATRVSPKD